MTASLVFTIKILRIAEVCASNCLCQCCCRVWNDNKVYVVGHETIAQHMDAVFLSKGIENGQVGFPIFIVQKHLLAGVAPLRNR